jgi:hypothetical protein
MLTFYNVIEVPVLLHVSENRVMNRSDRRIIKTVEMKFLKYVSRHTLRDQVSNTDIRQLVGISDLNERDREHKNQLV